MGKLIEDARDHRICVDLERLEVTTSAGHYFPFAMDEFRRDCLMAGQDEVALTMASEPAIRAYEQRVESDVTRMPEKQGLYDPANEHDACGVGFVANIKGEKSNDIVRDGLLMLANLDHRGARGADPLVGDGAGCLIQMPDALLPRLG